MTSNKNVAGNLLPLTVTEGVSVNVLPYEQYEYLMTTKEVASGYGVTEYAILKNKLSLSSELVEGKHFVKGVTIGNGGAITNGNSQFKIAHNAILWTKRGVVRLGFAMRSERAKLFRDWAEELIIRLDGERDLFGTSTPVVVTKPKALPDKRKHNRLTPGRMASILADVCQIEDKALRLRIVGKLTGKEGNLW